MSDAAPVLADVSAVADAAAASIEATNGDIDIFYLLLSGYLVFFMQCGFAMLSAGSVRSKNAKNIILKNLLDACFGAIGWYLTGYAFAYGDDTKIDENGETVNDGNGFIGTRFFAFNDLPRSDFASWFFQYAFAATAATIVSGAVAERTKFEGYLCYAVFLTMFVYPVVAHWVWSGAGWASAARAPSVGDLLFDSGVVDFAGCGVVHMTGGLAGLAGAWVVGPRIGRFDADGKPRDIPGHNAALAILGVFILWFGWFGFNPGSTLGLTGGLGQVAATCAATTTLSAAAGTIGTLMTTMALTYMETGHIVWDLIATSNGTLAGLVGITASCSVVKSWAAIIIGLAAGILYVGSSRIVSHVLKVDDPLDAVAVHGFMGAWGLIAAGLFADEDEMELAYGRTVNFGLFMGGGGKLLGANIIILLVITGWVLGLMFPFFFVLKQVGLLRVDPEEEHAGLDVSHHGGSAYADADEGAKAQKYVDSGLREEVERLKQEVGSMREAMRGTATNA